MPPKKRARTDESAGSSTGKKRAKVNYDNKKAGDGLLNKASTDFACLDFANDSCDSDGNRWNLKISTWNVDGIRAWIKKGGLDYIGHEDPDILCLQEVKCSDDKLPKEARNVDGYTSYWTHGETEGYAGVGLYTKVKPVSVSYGIGDAEFDKEGRMMVAEYEKFYLVNVYVPNSGRGLVTLPKRMEWDPKFQKLLKDLDTKKPVIVCGDLNVAHHEIDIANPKGNKKNAGFTMEERNSFTDLLKGGFMDSFRHKYPKAKDAYTFWSYMSNARKKNIGWRLDYCLLSEKLEPRLCDCIIRNQVFGSDHCPSTLLLRL